MWKKTNPNESPEERALMAASTPRPPVTTVPSAKSQPARIGASLFFKGELTGEEDLVIEGRVEGKIVIKKGNVTVGDKGRVEADIEAASIQVAGLVKGNLSGAERVVLLESGRVEGNITAKSVILENGCRFKGSIDMETETGGRSKSLAAASSSTTSSGTASVDRPNGTQPARVGV
jgi:cytoskeletal protein CcmA (bactofilin family)